MIMKRHARKYTLLIILMMMALVISSCGDKEELSVEDEVSLALMPESRSIESLDDISVTDQADSDNLKQEDTVDSAKSVDPALAEPDKKSGSSDKGAQTQSDKSTSGNIKYTNPYLGNTSTATDYKIDFEVQLDSGVAGITWGGTREHAGAAPVNTDDIDDTEKDEYYIAAFDCTREIPRFYFARYKDGYIYDESYTNLDFMFPEMVMFTDVQHIVEIKVSGMAVTVYLDKYKVCDLTLNEPGTIGLLGTWVKNGDYSEYIDNVFAVEGSEGDGDWIYSDDFSARANMFSPNLHINNGRLYAKDGYYTVSKKK